MKFSQLANILEKLEGTTKRLEITAILADLVNNLQEDEVDLGVYLSLGYLQSEFESEKFNIAEKMMKKILASAFDKTAEQIDILFSKSGDLGSVAAGLASKQKGFDVSIKKVYKMLTEIAQVEGAGSQEKKITKTASLLSDANKLSAKYLVRIILGTTRLGFTELTVIEALVAFLNGGEKNKNLKEKVESKYRIHPDIGLIAKKIKQKGDIFYGCFKKCYQPTSKI